MLILLSNDYLLNLIMVFLQSWI